METVTIAISSDAESVFIGVCLGFIAFAGSALLVWMTLVRPRAGLYALLALAPTQFVFIPISDFFVSPADVLALGASAGLLLRVATRDLCARAAVQLHVMLGVMIVGYIVGFVVLDHSSRTLLRLPLAIVPSILACELLLTRRHFALATSALVVGGLLDTGYGLAAMAAGSPLHPSRFSGMMGVNFSAIAILTGAVVAASRTARAPNALKMLPVVILALPGLATLSRMGIIASATAVVLVVWPLATPMNRRLIAAAGVLILAASFGHSGARERLITRAVPEVQLDGIARTSGDVRGLILRTAWDGFTEQPFVGVGFFGFQDYSLKNMEIRKSTAGLGYGTHNTYVEVLVEGGVLAFAGFMLHFLAYGRSIPVVWMAIVRRKDVLVGATVAGLVVVLVSAGGANILLHYLFWGVSGIALACFTRLRGTLQRSRPSGLDFDRGGQASFPPLHDAP